MSIATQIGTGHFPNRVWRLALALLMAVPTASTADAFEPFTRWRTTSRGSFGSTLGTPAELTWSIVADGTAIAASSNRHAAGTSNLIAKYGLSTIESRLTTVYGRLSAISGLSFFREVNDSGTFPWSSGVTNVRGDLRIAGINFFTSSNVLAYNQFPEFGDMVYNTNKGLSTSVLYHEIMHGLGVDHVSASSTRNSSIMLPSLDGAPGSPQLDDILALHYLYGDVHEKSFGNLGNGIPTRATSLGALAAGSTVSVGTSVSNLTPTVGSTAIDFVSISRSSDVDFFKFTLSAPVELSGLLAPKGPTYLTGSEGGSATSFNSKAQNDLTLTIFGTDGTTVLGTYNNTGLGGAESFQEMFLTAPGDYYARVTGSSDNTQMYRMDVSAAAHPYFWDNSGSTTGFGTASGTWAAETIGNASQGWVMNQEGTTTPGNVTTSAAAGVRFGTAARGLGAGTIIVSGTVQSGNLNFGAASGHIQLAGGTINLADTATIRIDNAINTIQSAITGAEASLTKTGNGTLVLSGGGSGDGALILQAGTVRIGAHDGISTSRPLVIPNGSTGQLDLNGFNQTLGGLTPLLEDGTTMNITIAGGPSSTLTINATAAASFGPGGVSLTDNAARVYTFDVSGLGGFAWNGANQTFRVGLRPGTSNEGSTGNFTVLLANSSSITASTITLGDVVASTEGGSSFLRLGQSTALNATTISLGTGGRSNATMNLQSGLTGVPTVTIRGMDGVSPVTLWDVGRVASFNTATWRAAVDMSGSLLDAKVSTLQVATINTGGAANRRGRQISTFTMGRGVLEAGSIVVGNYSGSGGSVNGPYTADGTFTLDHAEGLVRAGSVILANNVGTSSNKGSGAKTVIGRFNLNAGTLEAATINRGAGTGNANTVTPEFNFSGGTVRNAVGQNLTISHVPVRLTGAGTRIFEATAGQTITVASNAVISGTGLGFTKAGDGTMIIDSNSTYTGLTTVSAGTLLVNGTHAGDFTVASGAALGGTGTISGNMTLGGDSLFWIANLNSPLTMGVGRTLSFTSAGGGFGIDRLANIDWDSLLTGTYTLVSGNVDFANIRNVGLSNAFLLDSGYSAYFQEGSLQLVVTPVPEPSTLVILAAGAGILGLRATRRRQAK